MDLDMIDKLSNGLANEPNSQQQQTAVLRLLTFENAWPGKQTSELLKCYLLEVVEYCNAM